MPHFTECEAIARVEYLPCEASAISKRLYEGAMNLGWHAIEAPRLYSYGGRGGSKQSMSETFVPRFLKAGGRLIADNRRTPSFSAGRQMASGRHPYADTWPFPDGRDLRRQGLCRMRGGSNARTSATAAA